MSKIVSYTTNASWWSPLIWVYPFETYIFSYIQKNCIYGFNLMNKSFINISTMENLIVKILP